MAGRDWNYKGKGAWEPKTGGRGPHAARHHTPHQARSRSSTGHVPAVQGVSGGARKSSGAPRANTAGAVNGPRRAASAAGKAGRKSAGGSKRSREQAASSGAWWWQQRAPWWRAGRL
jgi:hypothetical protein